jgi:hypothetical protein
MIQRKIMDQFVERFHNEGQDGVRPASVLNRRNTDRGPGTLTYTISKSCCTSTNLFSREGELVSEGEESVICD